MKTDQLQPPELFLTPRNIPRVNPETFVKIKKSSIFALVCRSEGMSVRGAALKFHPIVSKLRPTAVLYPENDCGEEELQCWPPAAASNLQKYSVSLCILGTAERQFWPPRRVLRTINQQENDQPTSSGFVKDTETDSPSNSGSKW